jgi:hypothetical protein
MEIRKVTRVFCSTYDVVLRWKYSNGFVIELRSPVDNSLIAIIDNDMSIFKDLFLIVDDFHKSQLLKAPSQGRYFASLSSSSLSPVVFRNLSFCDHRFIHKARLCLTPTNSRSFYNDAQGCRRCSNELESLSHVLNCCLSHRKNWMTKHNNIVNNLVDIIRKNNPTAGFSIDNSHDSSGLRPDIVVKFPVVHKAFIIDVKCPIDLKDRIHQVRQDVTTKYTQVANSIKSSGLMASTASQLVALKQWR